jgi:hypothetical protein
MHWVENWYRYQLIFRPQGIWIISFSTGFCFKSYGGNSHSGMSAKDVSFPYGTGITQKNDIGKFFQYSVHKYLQFTIQFGEFNIFQYIFITNAVTFQQTQYRYIVTAEVHYRYRYRYFFFILLLGTVVGPQTFFRNRIRKSRFRIRTRVRNLKWIFAVLTGTDTNKN